MLSQTEYTIGVKSTQAFIAADYEDLVFSRTSRVSDGEGGWTNVTPVSFGPLRCRLVPQSDRVEEVSTSDGRSLRPSFVLVALPTEDLQRYDRFDYKGDTYELASVRPDPEYALKADVVLYG